VEKVVGAAAGPLAGLLGAILGLVMARRCGKTTWRQVGLAFVACLGLGLRELPSWRTRLSWLGTVLLGSIATGLPMALADPFVISQVNAGNPWFQPVIGYSLPVFLVIVLALIGVWVWARWQDAASDRRTTL
jgi:hypothetical protein